MLSFESPNLAQGDRLAMGSRSRDRSHRLLGKGRGYSVLFTNGSTYAHRRRGDGPCAAGCCYSKNDTAGMQVAVVQDVGTFRCPAVERDRLLKYSSQGTQKKPSWAQPEWRRAQQKCTMSFFRSPWMGENNGKILFQELRPPFPHFNVGECPGAHNRTRKTKKNASRKPHNLEMGGRGGAVEEPTWKMYFPVIFSHPWTAFWDRLFAECAHKHDRYTPPPRHN